MERIIWNRIWNGIWNECMDHFCACVGVTFDFYLKITPVVPGAHPVTSVVFSFVGGKA